MNTRTIEISAVVGAAFICAAFHGEEKISKEGVES